MSHMVAARTATHRLSSKRSHLPKRPLLPLALATLLLPGVATANLGGSLPQVSSEEDIPAESPNDPAESPPAESDTPASPDEANAPSAETEHQPSSPGGPQPQSPGEPANPTPKLAPAPAAPPSVETANDESGADKFSDGSENPEADADADEVSPFNTMILVEAVAKYGLIGRGTDLLESDQDDPFDEKFSVGYFGAQATLGLMPARSAFTLAGRLRGGAYLGHSPALASMGAAMLFGANFARKEDGRSFSYAMGGLGVEFLPSGSQDMLTIHASGGTVINEFTLGAGIDFGINNEIFIATFGLQIGWGRLL